MRLQALGRSLSSATGWRRGESLSRPPIPLRGSIAPIGEAVERAASASGGSLVQEAGGPAADGNGLLQRVVVDGPASGRFGAPAQPDSQASCRPPGHTKPIPIKRL